MKQTIEVTQILIDSGNKSVYDSSPIALALGQAGFSDVFFTKFRDGRIEVDVAKKRFPVGWGRYTAVLPPAVAKTFRDWEEGKEINPFAFILDFRERSHTWR